MDIFSVLTMLGGLALFMFGMKQMGDGLEKAADGRLEKMLEKLTSSKWKGILLGAGITAIIQSSSATTVTMVGFVNSGIMKLSQATPVILGANVGTTITAWMLSLAGIDGSNFFVQMLKPSSFSPVLAVIGVILITFTKSSRKKDVGSILIGFAILMTGLEIMSDAVKPLANLPEFRNLFIMFKNPVMGVLVGALLTGIIQSSSASIGILQALSMTGAVSWAAAIPIIMGQNIGTCVTALLSGIGANKNARRVSMVHLYFNIIGTLVFLTIFLLVKPLFGTFFDQPIDILQIAIVHSVFNVSAVVVMSPFLNVLEWLAVKTIPDRDEDQKRVLIDDRLLAAPSIALSRCSELTRDMAKLSRAAVISAFDLFRQYDDDMAKKIESAEQEVDRYEDALGSFLVKMSDMSLSATEGREVSRILHGIGEYERISDHALNLQETAKEIYDKKISFSQEADAELDVLVAAVMDILDTATTAYDDIDIEKAVLVEPLEQVIDGLTKELKLRHIERLRRGRCTVETGFVFADLLTNCERIADHCSNLAVCVIELSKNAYNAHAYVRKVGRREEFLELYHDALDRYALPLLQSDEIIEGQQSIPTEMLDALSET